MTCDFPPLCCCVEGTCEYTGCGAEIACPAAEFFFSCCQDGAALYALPCFGLAASWSAAAVSSDPARTSNDPAIRRPFFPASLGMLGLAVLYTIRTLTGLLSGQQYA